MKKELIKKIERYCNSTEFPNAVYFSDVVPDARFKKDKYFFKYHNTHTVAVAFKTQKEIEEFIEDNIEIKLTEGEKDYKVTKDYLKGVNNITEIESAREIANKLEVNYYDGTTVYYEKVHGTWGFPTTIE